MLLVSITVTLSFSTVLLEVSGYNLHKMYLNPRFYGPRIVGGYEVEIDSHPYQVSLRSTSHFCGGSIISKTFIMTAAHCTNQRSPIGLSVRVGSSYKARDGEIHPVKRIIQHSLYEPSTTDYDFSLLELATEIEFNEKAQAIVLAADGEDEIVGENCIVSGWGNTKNSSESSHKLRAAMVPIVDRELCNEVYSDYYGVTKRMLCAGDYEKGGKDSCQGDSGGPLVKIAPNNESFTLIGVVSWGKGCAVPHFPGVYAKISSVRAWVKENSGV